MQKCLYNDNNNASVHILSPVFEFTKHSLQIPLEAIQQNLDTLYTFYTNAVGWLAVGCKLNDRLLWRLLCLPLCNANATQRFNFFSSSPLQIQPLLYPFTNSVPYKTACTELVITRQQQRSVNKDAIAIHSLQQCLGGNGKPLHCNVDIVMS